MENHGLKRELGLRTAILVIIASMIGAGIFGNTGIIHAEVQHPLVVILLWGLGGIIALSGAMCYAELATIMPHAGGEYLYISRIFGRLPSFLTGWVSFFVGFSAPAAAAALLSAEYAREFAQMAFPGSWLADFYLQAWNRKIHAVALIFLFSYFHMLGVRKGGMVQNVLTGFKLFSVILFAAAGFYIIFSGSSATWQFPTAKASSIHWSGMGVGLLFVMFAYSGWNGATYLAGEIRNPEKNLPRALLIGTLLITALYVVLNIIYYYTIPQNTISGKEAVAALAADALFGKKIAVFFHLVFFIMLLSSVSVSIMIGPRVYFAMARDNLFFKIAGGVSNYRGTPAIAIVLQGILAVVYIVTGTYDQIQAYMGFALGIFPILSVVGLMYLRKKNPNIERPYRVPLYPLAPLFFILFSVAILITSFIGRPEESSFALAVVGIGVVVFYVLDHSLKLAGKPGLRHGQNRIVPGETTVNGSEPV